MSSFSVSGDGLGGARFGRRRLLRAGLGLGSLGWLLQGCDPVLPDDSVHSIDVLNVWSGEEQNSFKAVVAPFTQHTGIVVNAKATRDLDAALALHLSNADPPDVVVIPNPDKLRQLASQNYLVRLDSFLDMEKMREDYANEWLNLASYNGSLYALIYKAANKGTIWYSPAQFHFRGYEPPANWDGLIALSNLIARSGGYPWALGVESATASGWPAADWIAELYLKLFGPDLYDAWVEHAIPWTDATIKQAFEVFGSIIAGDHYIAGAPEAILRNGYDVACYQPFAQPPSAYMDYLGDFAAGFITNHFPQARPGVDFNFFPFPSLTASYAGSLTVGADMVVAMRDNIRVRQFMAYLATADAQTILVRRGGATSVNRSLNLANYPNDVARASAQMVLHATPLRFGAGDMMPFVVEQAFWKGLLAFIADQSQLDSILHAIELTARQAYSSLD